MVPGHRILSDLSALGSLSTLSTVYGHTPNAGMRGVEIVQYCLNRTIFDITDIPIIFLRSLLLNKTTGATATTPKDLSSRFLRRR